MGDIITPIICAIIGSSALFGFIQFLIQRNDTKKLTANQKELSAKTDALSRGNAMRAARQEILQMILEDKINVAYSGLPENYQSIHDAFDTYLENGGNSYIVRKVEEYERWYQEVEDSFKGGLK